MKLRREGHHLVMIGLLLINGVVNFIVSQVFVSSVSELHESQEKRAAESIMYPENVFDVVLVQCISLIMIIVAYIPYMRFKASLDLLPYYYDYRDNGSKESFLLVIFHEKMLHFEFVNLVVYLILFIIVFCLFALETYKPGNILRLIKVFSIPSEEEVQLYSKIFEEYGEIFDGIRTSLLLIGEGCLAVEEITWRNIQYHFEIIKGIRRPKNPPRINH